jgi:hypothetical protein
MSEQSKCIACGNVQDVSANFCMNCGERVSKKESESDLWIPDPKQSASEIENRAPGIQKVLKSKRLIKIGVPAAIVILLVGIFAINNGANNGTSQTPSADPNISSTPTPTSTPIPTDPLSLDYIRWFQPTLSEYRSALSRMNMKTDAIQGITWVEPKSSPTYADVNGIWAYIGCTSSSSCKPGSQGILRLKIQYGGTDWLFITEYHFDIDGDNTTYDFNLDYSDVKRDNANGRVWEYYDSLAEPTTNLDYFNLIQTLASSKNAVYRASGDQGSQDFVVTQSEKSALRDALTVWFGLNNGVKTN